MNPGPSIINPQSYNLSQIEVWDLGKEEVVASFAEAHDRVVHCLRLNECSSYASHPSESYDLFLSSATDGLIGLWDLRAGKRVCRFAGHQNRVHPIGASFSPCLRYIASGSEDKLCYLFDLRAGSGTYMEKLGGHSDVVTDTAYNPLHPQLATACADGKIRKLHP